MDFDDNGPRVPERGVRVYIDGDKFEQRDIDHIDVETGLIYPVLSENERAHHTVDGRVYVIRTNGGW